HNGVMSLEDARREAREDLIKVARVRGLVAMLVALIVGYKGRLNGWDPTSDEDAPATCWTPEVLPDEIHWAFLAKRPLMPSRRRRLTETPCPSTTSASS